MPIPDSHETLLRENIKTALAGLLDSTRQYERLRDRLEDLYDAKGAAVGGTQHGDRPTPAELAKLIDLGRQALQDDFRETLDHLLRVRRETVNRALDCLLQLQQAPLEEGPLVEVWQRFLDQLNADRKLCEKTNRYIMDAHQIGPAMLPGK